jgi:hypothetical protein
LAPTQFNPSSRTSNPTTRRPSSSSAMFGVNLWLYSALLFVVATGHYILF